MHTPGNYFHLFTRSFYMAFTRKDFWYLSTHRAIDKRHQFFSTPKAHPKTCNTFPPVSILYMETIPFTPIQHQYMPINQLAHLSCTRKENRTMPYFSHLTTLYISPLTPSPTSMYTFWSSPSAKCSIPCMVKPARRATRVCFVAFSDFFINYQHQQSQLLHPCSL